MADTLKLDFTPYLPTRPDHMGELIFIKKWQKLNGGETPSFDMWSIDNDEYYGGQSRPALFDVLKEQFNCPTQSDARASASFAQWLGTHSGGCFLDRARQRYNLWQQNLPKKFGHSLADAYRLEWDVENRRCRATNGNATRMDAIAGNGYKPTLRDYEIMCCMAGWLGTQGGQAYLTECAANIALKQRRMRQMQPVRPSFVATPATNPVTNPTTELG